MIIKGFRVLGHDKNLQQGST